MLLGKKKNNKVKEPEDEWDSDEPVIPLELQKKVKATANRPLPPLRVKQDGQTPLKQKAYYSDDALIKMVNLLYDPMTIELCKEAEISDIAQLLSLTNIKTSREAFYWSHRIATEAYANRYRPGGTGSFHDDGTRKWTIGKIEMVAFLIARRSMTMPVGSAFALGVGLAQEQSITKAEDLGDGESW